MIQLKGRRYENGEPVCVVVEAERIVAVEPATPRGHVNDWPYVAPAMFDLQINGHGGVCFSSERLTADEALLTLEPHFRYGITRLCPTLITASYAALQSGFEAIREACEREVWADRMVPGCHLEGPFISPEDGPRGAHPLQHVRPADWDEFCRLQNVAGNRIRLVTLAPEADHAIEFIRRAVETGVIVAIGHTAATPVQIQEAVEAGARLSTHLGNGAHGVIRRHPNYIWEQLGDPRLMASIITDGHHLPSAVMRSVITAKTPANTIITCDAAGLAGCPPGIYSEGDVELEVLEDGRIVIAGQRQLLAGSSLETDTCVANAVALGHVSLQEALDMAGRNPARLLGFEEIRLGRGSRADLILFHYPGPPEKLDILATMAAGQIRYGAIPEL